MRNAEHITINTFLGETWSGLEVKHQRNLPKSAKLLKVDYDLQMNDIQLYISFGKKSKYFILQK
tara:strand:+ start:29 stop:220 length:192 start_codon:yes stop_codon:yes gene_type:complete